MRTTGPLKHRAGARRGIAGKDFKREWKELYAGKAGRIDEVDVPKLQYLAIEGKGDPTTAIGPAIGAVCSVGYPLKFAIKARDPKLDYVVMPPEALYHGKREVYLGPREEWTWTVLMLQPVKPTAAEMKAALARAAEKEVPGAKDVRLVTLTEGRCVQTLHLGPYANEHDTIERMHAYMAERGYGFAAPHHEIYLSDPMRVAPEKLKTLLRQPVTAPEKKSARVAVAV